MDEQKALGLYLDEGKRLPAGQGGLLKAIVELCVLLGSGDNNISQQCNDDADAQPVGDGWVVVTNLEGSDAIWHQGRCLATVVSSSRGFWVAWATLADGSKLYSQGSNSKWLSDPWRKQ